MSLRLAHGSPTALGWIRPLLVIRVLIALQAGAARGIRRPEEKPTVLDANGANGSEWAAPAERAAFPEFPDDQFFWPCSTGVTPQ